MNVGRSEQEKIQNCWVAFLFYNAKDLKDGQLLMGTEMSSTLEKEVTVGSWFMRRQDLLCILLSKFESSNYAISS